MPDGLAIIRTLLACLGAGTPATYNSNMLHANVAINHHELTTFCRKYGVARLSLFGSVLRQDFDPDRSDVDVLVEFTPGVHKGLFKLSEMQEALGRMFGCEVDLTTTGSLSKYFREDVLATAEVLYDAA
jgi:predicted nucleotidyltransferase